ncbi:hypothetical protein Godav_006658 [Gossypium davidsonii]|uniref:Uncharacterized protein n=1 Tax=Gossypium davidsonii TaxID=34287 RepID=A0A7J8S5B8_GOSDV|nr:hypothetical protein [Gossypium davidsonii]
MAQNKGQIKRSLIMDRPKLASSDISLLLRVISSPLPSPHFGNTEEKFFDSIQWLKSDSEDFFSVNGGEIFPNFFHPDFTFSCGNSPKNLKTLKENSPTDTKKQLIELFRESSNDYDDDDDAVNNYPNMKDELEDKAVMLNKIPKSRSKSPHESIFNSIGSNKARCFTGEEKPAHEI